MTNLEKCIDDGILHVALFILGLIKNEFVKMVFQIVGNPSSSVAVVYGEKGQFRISLQVGKGRAPEKWKYLSKFSYLLYMHFLLAYSSNSTDF